MSFVLKTVNLIGQSINQFSDPLIVHIHKISTKYTDNTIQRIDR
jgi:hypothetical protein